MRHNNANAPGGAREAGRRRWETAESHALLPELSTSRFVWAGHPRMGTCTALSLSHAEKQLLLSPFLFLSSADTFAHSWSGDRRDSQGLAVVPVFSFSLAEAPSLICV